MIQQARQWARVVKRDVHAIYLAAARSSRAVVRQGPRPLRCRLCAFTHRSDSRLRRIHDRRGFRTSGSPTFPMVRRRSKSRREIPRAKRSGASGRRVRRRCNRVKGARPVDLPGHTADQVRFLPKTQPATGAFFATSGSPSACRIDHHRTEIINDTIAAKGTLPAFLSSHRHTNGSYPQSSVCRRRYFCAPALVPAVQRHGGA